jgi:hypothetical protein
MIEMKCPYCGKFIGVLDGKAEIKCSRCRRVAIYQSKPVLELESVPAKKYELSVIH